MKNLFSDYIKEHKPIIVNYGKGILSDNEVKEPAYYDEKIGCYRSDTGIWSNKLLNEIYKGEVKDMKIEIPVGDDLLGN